MQCKGLLAGVGLLALLLFWGGTQVADLTPLKDLTALTMLYVSRTPVSDLTPLKDLTALTEIVVSKGAFINDTLLNWPGLRVHRL